MNTIAVEVTGIRKDWRNDVEYKTTVTPVLNKNIGVQQERDDISSTFIYKNIIDFRIEHERTQLQSEIIGHVTGNDVPLNNVETDQFNPISDVNEQRITLLARKYATKHMLPEDAARLDILTQRFRNIMPAITENDLNIMESLNKQIASEVDLSKRLQEKYK